MELQLSNQNSTNTEKKVEKVLVLGAGPAGMAGALYAARAELEPLVLIGNDLGGQASLTYTIENYPGFPEGVGGAELGDLFKKQAERFGARFEYELASEVHLSKRPFTVKVYGKEYSAESLIIATGASPNHLNIPGEELLTGRG
jgi:thioredoxin reductase (NADPH)